MVDNNGRHGFTIRSGDVYLTAGDHSIDVRYFEHKLGAGIRVDYQPSGGVKRLLTGPFGRDIDVSGNWMVVGAADGKAYVYQRFNESWSWWQEFTGAGGFGTAVAVYGSKMVIGMPGATATCASASAASASAASEPPTARTTTASPSTMTGKPFGVVHSSAFSERPS